MAWAGSRSQARRDTPQDTAGTAWGTSPQGRCNACPRKFQKDSLRFRKDNLRTSWTRSLRSRSQARRDTPQDTAGTAWGTSPQGRCNACPRKFQKDSLRFRKDNLRSSCCLNCSIRNLLEDPRGSCPPCRHPVRRILCRRRRTICLLTRSIPISSQGSRQRLCASLAVDFW